jgi:SAM-dependent methyltransferase
MYETLKDVLSAEDGDEKRCLSISHSENLADIVGLRQVQLTSANYPESDATDLCDFEDGTFDFVVSDQVLEHVEGGAHKVFAESYRLLRPGGVAVHTSCFINPMHGWPSDYWRFTPNGLRALAVSSGFSDIIVVGGHGSRLIWLADLLGLRGVPVPHAKWHPMHRIAVFNMEAWPMMTWVVTRK